MKRVFLSRMPGLRLLLGLVVAVTVVRSVAVLAACSYSCQRLYEFYSSTGYYVYQYPVAEVVNIDDQPNSKVAAVLRSNNEWLAECDKVCNWTNQFDGQAKPPAGEQFCLPLKNNGAGQQFDECKNQSSS